MIYSALVKLFIFSWILFVDSFQLPRPRVATNLNIHTLLTAKRRDSGDSSSAKKKAENTLGRKPTARTPSKKEKWERIAAAALTPATSLSPKPPRSSRTNRKAKDKNWKRIHKSKADFQLEAPWGKVDREQPRRTETVIENEDGITRIIRYESIGLNSEFDFSQSRLGRRNPFIETLKLFDEKRLAHRAIIDFGAEKAKKWKSREKPLVNPAEENIVYSIQEKVKEVVEADHSIIQLFGFPIQFTSTTNRTITPSMKDRKANERSVTLEYEIQGSKGSAHAVVEAGVEKKKIVVKDIQLQFPDGLHRSISPSIKDAKGPIIDAPLDEEDVQGFQFLFGGQAMGKKANSKDEVDDYLDYAPTDADYDDDNGIYYYYEGEGEDYEDEGEGEEGEDFDDEEDDDDDDYEEAELEQEESRSRRKSARK